MVALERIVVASRNRGKCLEIARFLVGYEIQSLDDFDPVVFPVESVDYHENARRKALAAARAIGLPCVADDSGLEVACLDGAPGPLSARFGGPGLDDRGRVRHLLDRLAHRPRPWRARFFCVAARAHPDGWSCLAEGICEGEILPAPRGDGGFGYDPIFRPDGHAGSMAELGPEEKDAISHRGRAFRSLEDGPKIGSGTV